jgi:Zn-dependent protease
MDRPTAAPRSRGVIRVGSVRGVPVDVAPSWIAICLLLTLVYGPVIETAVPSAGSTTAYVASLGFAIVFAVCILAHEVGHTLVGLALGHPVRRIVLFALGGMSEMDDEPERARDDLLISGAGPAVSLAIAGVGWAAGLGLAGDTLWGALFDLLCWSNLLIAAFNLLPGLPLDGGRLLRGLLHACGVRVTAATVAAAWTGRALAVAVALSGLLVERTALGLAAGVISIGLAAYLWFAAGLAIRASRLLDRLPAVHVEDLLRPGLLVPFDVSVAEALRRAWAREVRGIVLVDSHEQPSAIVDEARIVQIPEQQRPWVQVSTVSRPLVDGLILPAGLDAHGLLKRMRDVPATEYLVVHADGSPAGIITAADFARRLSRVETSPVSAQ